MSAVSTLSFTNAYAAGTCDSDLPPKILNKDVAIQRLMQCNRDIIDIKRAVNGNEANLKIAGETQNPNLTLGLGELNPKLGIGSGNYFDKAVDTSVRYEQLIERGNKRELRMKAAQSQVAASQQDVTDIERQQSIILLNAMVDLAAVNERTNLLSEVTMLYQETLRANTVRAEKGDLPPIDAKRQEIDANRAQLDLHQAQAEAKDAQLKLAVLLGWESQANNLQVDSAILDVMPLDTNGFDVNNRADIRAAKLRLEAASSGRDISQAQLKSDVTAGVQYDHWPTTQHNTTGTGDTIGFTIGIPLNINHHFEGEITRANNDYDTAQDQLERTQANAKADWLRINTEIETAEDNLHILQSEEMPRAEDVARTVELGYKKGALSLLDLLDARRILRQARLDVLSARATLARALLSRNQSISAN